MIAYDSDEMIATGMHVYRGHLIERATKSNSYPRPGRWYIVAAWRDGIKASFPTLRHAEHIVDTLVSPNPLTTMFCSCGYAASGTPESARHHLRRHKARRCSVDGYFTFRSTHE